MTTADNGSWERETTLLICSDEPEEVVRQLADISEVASFRIGKVVKVSFRDFYLDIPERTLGRMGYALRVRSDGSTHMIALKGLSVRSASGMIERLELEGEWSEQEWRVAGEELESRGIFLPVNRFDPYDPLGCLSEAGLEVFHQRETTRILRDVFYGDRPGRIAEMAIDSVTYHIGGTRAFHWELEVETKTPDYQWAVDAFARELAVRFHGNLRLWKYGKLSTGIALRELLKPELSERLLDLDGRIRSQTYAMIEERLR